MYAKYVRTVFHEGEHPLHRVARERGRHSWISRQPLRYALTLASDTMKPNCRR